MTIRTAATAKASSEANAPADPAASSLTAIAIDAAIGVATAAGRFKIIYKAPVDLRTLPRRLVQSDQSLLDVNACTAYLNDQGYTVNHVFHHIDTDPTVAFCIAWGSA